MGHHMGYSHYVLVCFFRYQAANKADTMMQYLIRVRLYWEAVSDRI